jgi:glycosyltransferase involved in cell wall biosynthesis
VVNFTAEPVKRAEADSIIEVPTHPGFLGRHLAWSDARGLECARAALERADLIVCHVLHRYHIQWAAGIARDRAIPYWVVPHGSLDPYVFTYRRWRKGLWMKAAGNGILGRAGAVVFATQQERRKAEMRNVAMNSRVLHWPVQAPACPGRPAAREQIRAALGIAPDDRVLLFLGRLHPGKRPLETIQALHRSGAKNVHLILVGIDGILTAGDCHRAARELGVSGVHAVGPQFGERKWEYLAACDGFISLSAKENFGYSVGEALVSGKPVILSPGVDLAPDLEALHCGWLLKSDDSEAAAAAIGEFARMGAEELAAAGNRGREWARGALGTETFRRRIQSLYQETVADRQRAPREGFTPDLTAGLAAGPRQPAVARQEVAL